MTEHAHETDSRSRPQSPTPGQILVQFVLQRFIFARKNVQPPAFKFNRMTYQDKALNTR